MSSSSSRLYSSMTDTTEWSSRWRRLCCLGPPSAGHTPPNYHFVVFAIGLSLFLISLVVLVSTSALSAISWTAQVVSWLCFVAAGVLYLRYRRQRYYNEDDYASVPLTSPGSSNMLPMSSSLFSAASSGPSAAATSMYPSVSSSSAMSSLSAPSYGMGGGGGGGGGGGSGGSLHMGYNSGAYWQSSASAGSANSAWSSSSGIGAPSGSGSYMTSPHLQPASSYHDDAIAIVPSQSSSFYQPQSSVVMYGTGGYTNSSNNNNSPSGSGNSSSMYQMPSSASSLLGSAGSQVPAYTQPPSSGSYLHSHSYQ